MSLQAGYSGKTVLHALAPEVEKQEAFVSRGIPYWLDLGLLVIAFCGILN